MSAPHPFEQFIVQCPCGETFRGRYARGEHRLNCPTYQARIQATAERIFPKAEREAAVRAVVEGTR